MLIKDQLVVKVELECIGESSLLFKHKERAIVHNGQFAFVDTAEGVYCLQQQRLAKNPVVQVIERSVTTPSATRAAPVA